MLSQYGNGLDLPWMRELKHHSGSQIIQENHVNWSASIQVGIRNYETLENKIMRTTKLLMRMRNFRDVMNC